MYLQRRKHMSKHKEPTIAICCLLALLLLLVIKRNLVRMIFYSNWDPQVPLHLDHWSGTIYTHVPYSEVSDSNYLNLYVPNEKRPPLLVLVHGGGFVFNDCESRQAQLFYQYMRDHGYACATVNYRLAQEAKFPAALQDVKCAIRYLRANADVYGYDADSIIIWGESAGGYLAVMAGVTTDEQFNDLPFIGEAEHPPVSAKVHTIVDYYGAVHMESWAKRKAAFRELGVPGFIVDLSGLWLSDKMKELGTTGSVEEYFTGVNFDTAPESETAKYSPAYYIEQNLTPESGVDVIIWHGDADLTVPVTESKALYDQLQRLGINSTLRIFHNVKHAGEKMYSDTALADLDVLIQISRKGAPLP